MNTLPNALVTVAVGDHSQAVLDLTRPAMSQYCERFGYAFRVIQDEAVKAEHPKFEKLQLFDLLQEYERILFLDADIIVTPHCPDLVAQVPPDRFGAYFDSNGGNGDADVLGVREDEMAAYQAVHGDIGWRKDYFNSGVMVLSKHHRSLFAYPQGVFRSKRFIDQTFLNYRLQCSGLPWQDIGQSFNHFMALSRSARMWEGRFASNLIHYAGFSDFYPELSITQQLESDMRQLFERAGKTEEIVGR